MVVEELIAELQKLPGDSEVILQKDAEGNGYSPLSGVDGEAIYRADSTWSGEVYDARWSANDVGFDNEDWENFKADNQRCCVLFPVN